MKIDSNEVKKISDKIFKEDDNVLIKNLLDNYNKEINKGLEIKEMDDFKVKDLSLAEWGKRNKNRRNRNAWFDAIKN